MGKLLTNCSIAIAILAITIGAVGKFAPHLFFKIPKIGFIPWAVMGGAMPPYLSTDPWSPENRGWVKPNDVVVSVAAKSGTTWMLFCSHQIRVKGNDEKYPYGEVMMSTPWPDLVQTPGSPSTMSWESRRTAMNDTILPDGTPLRSYWDHKDYPFRIFKSHYTPDVFEDLIGGDSKVKFLAMARNGLDQVASAVPFFDAHSEEFRNMWGGLPPARSVSIQEVLPGGIFGGWHFDYVNKWWDARKEKNVLLLHYSDAKKDLAGTVKKMAKFYDVNLSSSELKKCIEKCSFPYMKENEHLFHYSLPLNPAYEGKRIMKDGRMIRKGTVGDGKISFTKEEQELWAKTEEEIYGSDPEKLAWVRNGADP